MPLSHHGTAAAEVVGEERGLLVLRDRLGQPEQLGQLEPPDRPGQLAQPVRRARREFPAPGQSIRR